MSPCVYNINRGNDINASSPGGVCCMVIIYMFFFVNMKQQIAADQQVHFEWHSSLGSAILSQTGSKEVWRHRRPLNESGQMAMMETYNTVIEIVYFSTYPVA